ncbi:MAG: flavodoxin domain-containing protein [Candidatus Corynebacterium faecigallinarum]
MKSVIITESYFGNTATIAEELSAGLTSAGAEASVITAEEALEAPAAGTERTDLVILAVPTHNMGLPTAKTRQQAADKGAGTVATAGIREWIDAAAGTSATSGTRIIVMSTTTGGAMAGSAAKAAVKGLKKKRVTATRGEDFTVTDVPGPLAAGEKERARAWARTLL